MIEHLDWIAGAVELIALWMVGSRRRAGFLLAAAACATWVYVAVSRDVPGLLLVVLPACLINVRNWVRWGKWAE